MVKPSPFLKLLAFSSSIIHLLSSFNPRLVLLHIPRWYCAFKSLLSGGLLLDVSGNSFFILIHTFHFPVSYFLVCVCVYARATSYKTFLKNWN